MADVNKGHRPLSPHLQIYRPQLGSMTSIFTRITGNALLVAALLIVWYFMAAASGPEAFARADAVITSWFGDLIMFGSLWAIWYHLLAGLRHLHWDSGRGFDLDQAKILSLGVIGGSLVLTVVSAFFL